MTENDYIAEYVRERHSQLLGLDYAMWKFSRKISEAARTLGEAFSKIDYDVLKEELDKEGKGDEGI